LFNAFHERLLGATGTPNNLSTLMYVLHLLKYTPTHHFLQRMPSTFLCHTALNVIILRCFFTGTPVDVPKKIDTSLKRREHKFTENYQTCFSFIQLLWRWTIIPVG